MILMPVMSHLSEANCDLLTSPVHIWMHDERGGTVCSKVATPQSKAGKEYDLRNHVPSVPSAAVRACEQLLLTIGSAGVLSSRAIAAGELEELLRLLGTMSERQRSDLRRATDIVLIENGTLIYWPRTGEQFHIRDAVYAMALVQATLAS